MAFKMKRGAAPKFKELGSSPKKMKSPAKIDLTKGFKIMYNTGKELYDKIPKEVKNVIKDTVNPNPYSRLFRVAREQSPTFRNLTNKPVEKMIEVKNTIKEKLGK